MSRIPPIEINFFRDVGSELEVANERPPNNKDNGKLPLPDIFVLPDPVYFNKYQDGGE